MFCASSKTSPILCWPTCRRSDGKHVNLTGDYVWGVEQSLPENIDGLRSLRTQADALQKAA
jgi:hypothetical protein